MTKTDFLTLLEQLLGCDAGTLKGPELLADLSGWDSLGAVGFVALVDDKLGMTVAPSSLRNCKSVDDLCALVSVRLAA